MIKIALSFCIGVLLGIVMMCVLAINNKERR